MKNFTTTSADLPQRDGYSQVHGNAAETGRGLPIEGALSPSNKPVLASILGLWMAVLWFSLSSDFFGYRVPTSGVLVLAVAAHWAFVLWRLKGEDRGAV